MSSRNMFPNFEIPNNFQHFDEEISQNEHKPLIEDSKEDNCSKKKNCAFFEDEYKSKKINKRWSMLKDQASYYQIINEEVDSNEASFPSISNNNKTFDRRFSSENCKIEKSKHSSNLIGSAKWAALTKKNAEQLLLKSENTKPVIDSAYDLNLTELDTITDISAYKKDNSPVKGNIEPPAVKPGVLMKRSNTIPKQADKWGTIKERTSLIVKPTDEFTKKVMPSNDKPLTTTPKLLKVVTAVTAAKTATTKFREASKMRIRLKERMRKIVQERLTVKQIFKRYIESSTLHGFCYVCMDTFLGRRLIWAVLMILGAIYFIFKLRYGIKEYFDYPFSTLSTVEYVDDLLFPAVSVCATNSYIASQVYTNQLNTMYKEGRLPLDNNQSIPEYNIPGDELVKTLKNSSLTIESLLKYCDWIMQDTSHPLVTPNNCGALNFTSYFNYKGEQCHTLNSGAKGHELLKVSDVGISHGYELVFDLQTNEVIKNYQLSGMRIVIHDQVFPPQLVDGFFISPGFKTYIKLGITQSQSLPPPYSTECGQKKLKYYAIYSQRLCLLETLTDFTGDLCGCRDVFMPENGLPFCSLQELYSCMYPAKESFSEFTMRKECPSDCEERTFSYELSEARYLHNPPIGLSLSRLDKLQLDKSLPSEAHLSKLAKSLTPKELDAYIESNIISVILFFGDTRIDYHEQEATNDFFQFLGNMGGEFGLMLGASLLTFVEFIDLFIVLLYHQMLRLYNLRKIPDIFASKRNRNKEKTKKCENV
ncbi:acid-sensing ion channel 2 isoform X1 [Hydra vulgaris]|nr:acid-sensing ion channel 2 [Hydra vulgaris]